MVSSVARDGATTCAIVGAGPAGTMLALLLARAGVAVTLLEMHRDLDRDFRGDTVHPATLAVLRSLGYRDALLRLPHAELRELRFRLPGAQPLTIDLAPQGANGEGVLMMPQRDLLAFLVERARAYPTFTMHFGAMAGELIERDGRVAGIRYYVDGEGHELTADLVVAADGRFSKLRQRAGLPMKALGAPMDLLWFRLPRRPTDPDGLESRVGHGTALVMLDRGSDWQIAWAFAKDSYARVRAAGFVALQRALAEVLPEYVDRIEALRGWDQCSLLSVAMGRAPRWFRPGFLAIGDAAHIMSPVGGVGINVAVQDAVVAANLLVGPLRVHALSELDLARVQRARLRSVRLTQAGQTVVQRLVIEPALAGRGVPAGRLLTLPGVRPTLARLFRSLLGRAALPTAAIIGADGLRTHRWRNATS